MCDELRVDCAEMRCAQEQMECASTWSVLSADCTKTLELVVAVDGPWGMVVRKLGDVCPCSQCTPCGSNEID